MDDQNQNDELYPIAVLIDELKVRITEGALALDEIAVEMRKG